MNLPFPTELQAFAVWLAQSGAAGLIVSYLLERIPAFKAWKGKGKGLFVFFLFIAMPFIAQGANYAMTVVDPALLAQVQTVLNTALAGLAAWAASQWAHDKDPDTWKNEPDRVV